MDELIDRLEGARDSLMALAERPTNTRFERDRLMAKREGVLVALGYAREQRNLPNPGEEPRTPATVADLTRDHLGLWISIPERGVEGVLYGIDDDYHDGYPGRTLCLVKNDTSGTTHYEEFTDSNPAKYPKTMHTPIVMEAS